MTKISFWMSHWGLCLDPFSEEPLYYNTPDFEKLLVRYAPIEEIDDILSNFYEQKGRVIRRRYYIIGHRGMGKTTIFNYLLWKILKKPHERIMPIFVNDIHIKDPEDIADPAKDPEKLRLNFCLRTIEALFRMVLNTMKDLRVMSEYQSDFTKIRAKYFELKGKIPIDQSTSESLLFEYLNKLKKNFDLFILLYDELDKIDNYETVLRFLRSSQGLLETLSESGCVIFFSGVPDFSSKLRERESEYSGVKGHEIRIHTWGLVDAKTLVKNRLNYALFTGSFPFKDEVIEEICFKADGRPRLIQSQVRDSLIWGAYRGLKNIDQKFLDDLVWEDQSIKKLREEIKKAVVFEEAANILRSVYDPDRDDPTTYFVLTKIYLTSRLFILSPSGMRETYGIDLDIDQLNRELHLLKEFRAINEREVKGKKYYVLENKLQQLFDYVRNVLKESLEYLPRVVKMEYREIHEIQPEFNLSNEVIKILLMDPKHRYRRSELARNIINNPDTRHRALMYYTVSSDKDLMSKLLQGLPSVLNHLYKEGSINRILTGREFRYQYSEIIGEMEWARNLRLDADVVQNFESAMNNFKADDYTATISVLRTAVEKSLRHLAEAAKVDLPTKRTLDTLGPINDTVFRAKIYDQELETMITSFAIQANPINHGRVSLDSVDKAKILVEQAKLIIRDIYIIKKDLIKRRT